MAVTADMALQETVIAGSANAGAAKFKNGPALEAWFGNIAAACQDSQGNRLLLVERNLPLHSLAQLDRREPAQVVVPDTILPCCLGEVAALAGTGVMGFADSFCEQTIFDRPKAVCCTPDGLIYVADSDNFRIRCIDRKSNTVRTLAGSYKKGHKDAVAKQQRSTSRIVWCITRANCMSVIVRTTVSAVLSSAPVSHSVYALELRRCRSSNNRRGSAWRTRS